MSTERIGHRQLFLILFIMRTFVVISFLPVLTSGGALQDAWISTLIAAAATLPMIWLITALGGRFPQETVFEYAPRLLGPIVGRAAVLPFLWLYLWIAAIELRLYAEVIITAFLVETPIIVVVLSMVIVATLAAAGGIEVIGRVVDLLSPLFILAIGLSLFFPLLDADFANLLPVLARGWAPVLEGTVVPVAMTAQFTVLLVLLPSLARPKRFTPWALGAVLLSFAVLLVTVVMVIATLSAEDGARTLFPFFRMVRAIGIGGFLERVDALTILPWGLGVFIALSIYLLCGARGMAHLFNLSDYRPMLPPMAVVWAVMCIHNFDDIFEIRQILQPRYTGPAILTFMLTPLLLIWGAWALKRLRGGGSGR